MGLFDDLLKKPTSDISSGSDSSGSSGSDPSGIQGGNPPVTDPLAAINTPSVIKIEKTEEVSITTESPADTAPNLPPPVTAVGIDDVSSILIGGTTSSPDDGASEIVIAPSDSLISNVEFAGADTTAIGQNSEVVDLGNLFGDSVTVASHVISSAPVEQIPYAVGTESESISEGLAPVDTSSLLPETQVTPESTMTESFIDIGESTTPAVETSPTIGESTIDFGHSVVEEVEESYEHPSEFIAASIARIDAMVARIDVAHAAKLSEALGYKTEKEKYTELEEQAYADAEKYVTEKDHALAMRAYFVGQENSTDMKTLEGTELVASVETTLTGLAVQNAVSETVKHEKKEKNKKEESKKAEEPVGLLGL